MRGILLFAAILLMILAGCGTQQSPQQLSAEKSVLLYGFEGNEIPAEVVAEDLSFEHTTGKGVRAGRQALKAHYPQDTLYKKVAFEPEQPWDLSSLTGPSAIALEITNLSADSTQLWMVLKDETQSVTSHISIHAGASGTYYMDLAGPRQQLDLGMTGWPGWGETGDAIPFQYAWGTRELDLATLQYIGLYIKGNITERTLVFDQIRIVSRPESDATDLKGLVNRYGKSADRDWPGKVKSDQDLKDQAAQEWKELEQSDSMAGRSKYGGWADGPQLEATGYFRAQKYQEKWTLVDPEGYLFFAAGIANSRFSNTATVTGAAYENVSDKTGKHVVSELRRDLFEWLPESADPLAEHYGYATSIHTGPLKHGETYSFYKANLQRKYGEDYLNIWREVTLDRLQHWGFTCFGNWTDERFFNNGRVPYFAHVWIRGEYQRVSTGNDYWGPIHDPFDPKFKTSVATSVAGITDQLDGDPWCVGIFVDNEISWGSYSHDPMRFGIVINTLGRPTEESSAKAAFVIMLKQRYSIIEALNTAWEAELESWDDLAQGFEHTGELTGKRREDFKILSEALAEKYFKVVRDAVKERMPNHLYCGARLADWGMTPEVARAAAKYTDVCSYNMYTEGLPGHFGEWLAELDRPAILGEFHFGATDRGMFHGGICTAANQTERGVKYANYVRSVLESPYFVGAHWFQYVDSPTTGRAIDGENYNSGFVSVTDKPYKELVHAARELHSRLYDIRFQE
ncbi:MAG: beta-galactosidase [Verrucomicrobiota bacterium]